MEKSDVIIVSLCVISLFAWFNFNAPHRPPISIRRDTNLESKNSQDTLSFNDSSIKQKHISRQTLSGNKIDPENNPEDATKFDLPAEYRDLPRAQPVALITANFSELTISPNEGGITNIVLDGYKDESGDHLLQISTAKFPLLGVQNSDRSWAFSNPRIITADLTELRISRAIIGTQLELAQTWRLNLKLCSLDYVISIINRSDQQVTLDRLQVNCGTMPSADNGNGPIRSGGVDQSFDVMLKDESWPETIPLKKVKSYTAGDVRKQSDWDIKWLAVENKYFVSIMESAGAPFRGCRLQALQSTSTDNDPDANIDLIVGNAYLPPAVLMPGAEKSWGINFFVGPKKYELLKKLGDNKQSVLQFSGLYLWKFKWMELLSSLILKSLISLEKVFHNYGIAIVLITLIVRTLFWPVTYKSSVMSRKMRTIQPALVDLREKFENDPQQLQQKTIELYRQHNINPLAGCLPVFIQLPVFFGLFKVLRGAIELRQAAFLWVGDLSHPDTIATIPIFGFPINPLAILMCLTMILQQRLMSTGVEGTQKTMMSIMALVFMLFLYSMPSGLTLYWTTSQVITLIQYKMTNR